MSDAGANRLPYASTHMHASGDSTKRSAMLQSFFHLTKISVLTATILLIQSGSALAQDGTQRSGGDQNRCQATGAGSGNSTEKADLDSTYNACSLVDGFIGFGARINDGVGDTSGFGSKTSDQIFDHQKFDSNTHRLANLTDANAPFSANGDRLGRTTGNYSFGTRDFFALAENPVRYDGGAHQGIGHRYLGSADYDAPLLTSSGSRQTPPAGGSGIGGGGANGGLDSGSNVDVAPIPAIPEPQTYLLMLAGLALVSLFSLRQAKKI